VVRALLSGARQWRRQAQVWRAARPRMPRTLRPSSGTHALTWPCPALAVHLILLPTLSGVVLPCLAYSKTTKHAILNHHVSFPFNAGAPPVRNPWLLLLLWSSGQRNPLEKRLRRVAVGPRRRSVSVTAAPAAVCVRSARRGRPRTPGISRRKNCS
jgi:hypothetical protein